MRTAFLLLAGLAIPGSRLPAQHLEPRFPAVVLTSPAPEGALSSLVPPAPKGKSEVVLSLAGLLGGAAGVIVGGLAGSRIEGECGDCGDCCGGAIYGAIVGGSAGIPLAVHLADRRRGSLLPALGASLALGALGTALAQKTEAPTIFVALPVLQVVTSILIERRSGAGAGR